MAPLIKMGATALGKPGIANTLTKVGLGKTGAGQRGAGKTGAGHSNMKPKKTSAWIEFVKKYSKDKGIPYKQALSEAKAHYKK